MQRVRGGGHTGEDAAAAEPKLTVVVVVVSPVFAA